MDTNSKPRIVVLSTEKVTQKLRGGRTQYILEDKEEKSNRIKLFKADTKSSKVLKL